MRQQSEIDALIDVAHRVADAGRGPALDHFRARDLAAMNKEVTDFDPVTEADRGAEAAMRAVLQSWRPDDAILGEEHGYAEGTSGLTWILDPIDGTRGYISGTPTWGMLVACSDAGGPLFGIIDQPYIGERFEGGFGRAEVNGPLGRAALRTRDPRKLSEATLLTTFPEVGTPDEGAAFHRVSAQARLTRYGMDCYGYALLAAGQVDLVIEAGLQTYDIAAPVAVIEAAGGIVTSWEGGPAHQGGRALAAANPQIHAEAMAILNA